jgi:diketogulonate reductase-like aldo/keto reductase
MPVTRRAFLKNTPLASFGLMSLSSLYSFNPQEQMRQRPIPSSNEPLPVVGLGTWQTFDVGNSETELELLKQVLLAMVEKEGKLIDSSPMYGRSEEVVGKLTSALGRQDKFFYATKVWTRGQREGIQQMRRSMAKMRRESIDLMQIPNLVDWTNHLKTLRSWTEDGTLRYWGITHYTDSSHDDLEAIIRTEKPDFAQFNYSIQSRHAEISLFDTCKENNTAVIINQPFGSGSLFQRVRGKTLPPWAGEYDIESWGQYFLKFILAQPAVNCVIPGTSKPHHMIDNLGAGYGRLPNEAGRQRMLTHFNSL